MTRPVWTLTCGRERTTLGQANAASQGAPADPVVYFASARAIESCDYPCGLILRRVTPHRFRCNMAPIYVSEPLIYWALLKISRNVPRKKQR
jgi:hypothetical protein